MTIAKTLGLQGGLLRALMILLIAVLAAACGDTSSPDDAGGDSGTGGTAASGGGGGSGAVDGTLTVGVPNDCGGTDPTSTAGSGGGNWVCSGLISEGLLRMNEETGKTEPWLAETYEISEDGMSRTFRLREGITFQNGEPLNAEAVAFSIDRSLGRADYPGAADFQAGAGATMKARLDDDEPYTILDDMTIRLNYKTLDVTDTGSVTPVPPEYIREVGDDGYARAPITTGPYQLTSHTIGAEMVFERNEDYWNRDGVVDGETRWSPQWQTIIHKVIPEEQTRISALLAGEVDMITSVSPAAVPRLEENPDVNVVHVNGVQAIYILVNSCAEVDPNTGAPNPFRDLRVRQAMSHAVDVQAIIDNLLTGREQRIAGISPLQPFIDYDKLTYYDYDPEKAKALMAEAGYADGLPGSYDIVVPTGRWTASGEVTELIAEQLRVIGIDARMRPAEYQVVTTGIQENTLWPMAFFGVFSNVDSNVAGMLAGHVEGNTECMGRWNLNMYDPEIAELAAQAGETVDEEARHAIVTEAFRLYSERAYTINLYSNNVSHVLRAGLTWEPTQLASTNLYQASGILPQ